jgi:aerobic-type carbon monoxide dehydrogenase small subunit (CoxS/CutS family)
MSREGDQTTIRFDGVDVEAHHGEALLMPLLRSHRWELQHGPDGRARGPFCNMGTCFDCVVVLADGSRARSCLTPVLPGMAVTTRGHQ